MMLILGACRSDEYYHDVAVKDARGYALDNLRFLTPVQRSFIRFNKPELLFEPVYENTGLSQTCIVWHVPGIRKSVTVFGLGPLDMRNWKPYQVLLYKFKFEDIMRTAALAAARKYVTSNMVYLSASSKNLIRFSEPRILITAFKVPTKVYQYRNDERATRDLSRNLRNRIQVSFVWRSEEKGKKIVVTGLCNDNYRDWVPVAGRLYSSREIFENTLRYDVKSGDVKK